MTNHIRPSHLSVRSKSMQCASPLVLSSHWLEDGGDKDNSDVQLVQSSFEKHTYKRSRNDATSLSVHGKLQQEKDKAVDKCDDLGSNGMRSQNKIQSPTQGPRSGLPISANTSSPSLPSPCPSASSSSSTASLRHMVCPIDIDDGDESDVPWIKLSEYIPAILSHVLAILQVHHLPLSPMSSSNQIYHMSPPYHIILYGNKLKYITPHQTLRCHIILYLIVPYPIRIISYLTLPFFYS